MTSAGSPAFEAAARIVVGEPSLSYVQNGQRPEDTEGNDRADYRARADSRGLWRSFYEEALAAGSPTNAARFVASQRVRRLSAKMEGKPPVGTGDFESYY